MKRTLAAFGCGLLFAIGLGVSGMTRPSKVIGFLDPIGGWDPSLAFVMGGAVLVGIVAFRKILARSGPLLGGAFDLPPTTGIDRRLVAGAAVFGVGWGLGGFCPGPAIVGLATGRLPTIVFVAAMMIGIQLAERLDPLKKAKRQVAPDGARVRGFDETAPATESCG